jgi:pimeloyl-ACP methyl ester carboxylesterase
MPAVLIGAKQIRYWIGRGGLPKGGEALLFIHGAGGGQFVWSAQKAFFEKRYTTILVDLPGHGESGGEGEDEIAGYARHVHSFLGSLGLKSVFLVGHSMGGAIAQLMALDFPGAIKGMILVGTGARLKVLPVILDGIRNHFEETVRRMTRYAYSGKTAPEFIERGISELLKCRPEILYGDFLACDRFDITSRVGGVSLPALILCGEEDELTPVRYSKFLHENIKGSRLEVIPDAGHMVMLESPDLFNEKIHRFISDCRIQFAE